ncbi:MAG: type VI secretion system baseplate subunit TssG [Steroidobacteraceae bacterium]
MSSLERLRDEPFGFTLFAALRLLEQLYPERPRLGEARRASDDAVRLAQPPYLIFAPSDVTALGRTEDGTPRLEQYSFGIFGPNGALPLHLTEYAFERAAHRGDPGVADFINTFQHRFIALFYRAWADGDPTVNLDRPASDRFVRCIGALAGLAPPTARAAAPLAARAALGRAGLFGRSSCNAASLERVLSDYFGLAISIRPFIGGWLQIPDESRTRLGAVAGGSALGLGATLGSNSWQCQHQFEIGLGPLDYAAFERFLPGSPAFDELAGIVRFFTNDEWGWQLRPTLAASQAPGITLGRAGRLGWTGWLGGRAGAVDDVLIRGERAMLGAAA